MKGIARRSSAGLAAVLGSLVFVSAALGQSSSVQGYGGGAGEVSAGVGSGGTLAGGVAGNLPFTGLDLVFLLVAGAVVLVLGFVLRRSRA
jgi:membrane protease YdiL (CAAX protease family)